MRLSQAGEGAAVEALIELVAREWRCGSLEPGDDAFCPPGLESVVVNVDGYALSSSMLPWMSLYDVGWKAVVASASDVIAKGAKPLAVGISVGLNPNRGLGELVELVRGAADAARAAGAFLGGGDTNSSRGDEWVDVTVVGLAVAGRPIGFRPGPRDLVYTTVGRYGVTGLAYRMYVDGLEPPATVKAETARPRPRVEFLALARRLADCITAARDVSDGLAYTLHQLSGAAGSSMELHAIPVAREARREAERLGYSVEELALYGGEEYEIVFTVSPACEERVEEEARRLQTPVERIGRLTGSGRPGTLFYEGRSIEVKRWDQFRGYVAVAIG